MSVKNSKTGGKMARTEAAFPPFLFALVIGKTDNQLSEFWN